VKGFALFFGGSFCCARNAFPCFKSRNKLLDRSDDVIEIHAGQIANYGGSDGLRDRGLLESALAQT
jgi:hypothetical protein